MSSLPQTYTISDFIEWHNKHQLVLSPDFQRGSVWTPSAKVFLIDTILNDLPLPQIYFRTKVDPIRQTTIREVVDGQQRLRTILEFSSGKLRLTAKAPKFRGKVYSDLDVEDQERFLSYKVSVVQLLNASDTDVLEVFARLNSYSVKVTPPELRHAEYTEPVKWAIYDAAREWAVLWNDFKVVSVRDSVRLKNTSVIAEMFMILESGFGDGGEPSITKYYKSRKGEGEAFFLILRQHVDSVISEILEHTSELRDTTFYDAPNFLALFAAVAYLRGQCPEAKTTEGIEEYRGRGVDWQRGQTVLANIARAFDDENDENQRFSSFVSATKSTTHRISSRKSRMQTLVKSLAVDAT